MLDSAKAMLEASPFHAWLKPVLEHETRGEVRIRLPFRQDFIGNPLLPAYHGGIIAALVDMAGGAACLTVLGHPPPTVDLSVDFLERAGPGDLLVTGRVVRAGRTFAFAEADVRQGERVVARGRAVFSSGAAGARPDP